MKRIALFVTELLFALGIVLAVLRCTEKIKTSQEEAMLLDLQVSVENQAENLQKEIRMEQNFLHGLKEMLRSESVRKMSKVEKIRIMEREAETFGVVRIGIADKNGMARTTDDLSLDLRSRDFFVKAMEGEDYISGLILNSMVSSDSSLVVFSTPIENEKGVPDGVLFVTFDAMQLRETLNMKNFGEMAGVAIVEGTGNIVTATEGFDLCAKEDNLLVQLAGKINATKISTDLKNGLGGYQYATIDEGKYVYYAPLNIETGNGKWFVFSEVSANVLTDRLAEIYYDLPRMMILVVCFMILAFLAIALERYWDRMETDKKLYQYAYIDPITEGDNYHAFSEKMGQITSPGYMVSMDIHAFKVVNHVCGTEVGDMVLRYVWDQIREISKAGEVSGHINADHFALYLQADDDASLIARLNGLTERLAAFSSEMDTPLIIPYYGIYYWNPGDEIEQTESRAISARHRAKEEKNENFAFFTEEEAAFAIHEKKIEDSFDLAIEKKEFRIFLQPKYDPMDGSMVGAEALVRWIKEDGSMIFPGDFIPVLEKNGTIRQLDEYVFREVCHMQAQWCEEGLHIVPVSVNLSRSSVYFSDVVERYRSIIQAEKLDLSYVPVEITESASLDDSMIIKIVQQLANAGFELHMDDFGTGYSSLSSLIRLNFSAIKIDKSLIDTIGERSGELLLTHSIGMAKQLGMHVTAEGVENERQVAFLKGLHCDSIQGYFYSKPVPYETYDHMLRKSQPHHDAEIVYLEERRS